MKKLILLIAVLVMLVPVRARTGCVVSITHEMEGTCILTTKAICCNGPESCVIVTTCECY